jgi:septum formation protein
VEAIDEWYPDTMPAAEVPVFIARNKALAVKNKLRENRLVLTADTVVVLEGKVIGKPRDREDAIGILTELAGRRHEVVTGVVLVKGDKELAFADTTEVWFHKLTTEQVTFYVDKYKPYDKAGAYAIQEWIGVVGIKSIRGDFYNVMGLPVSRVVQALENF